MEDKAEKEKGTLVSMSIKNSSNRTSGDVFKEYGTEEWSFDRTNVPLILAQYVDGNLVSRSQAKRLLNRFEKFKEIILDFNKVDVIGQAFADEIFRVYKNNYPEVRIIPFNCNPEVELMIKRVQNRATEIE